MALAALPVTLGAITQPLVAGGTLAGAAAFALLVHTVAFRVIAGLGRRLPEGSVQGRVVERSRRPLRFLLPVVGVELAIPASAGLSDDLRTTLVHAVGIALIVGVAWLAIALTWILDDLVLARYAIAEHDNLRARRVHTQAQVLRRFVAFAIIVVAIAISLLSFSQVRAIGASLLASAGLVGVVVGVAAQPVLSNVMSGLQLAISQPIRIDDVVVVNGYWGRVEEITLTYVVVRVWDLRRVVLPISYFARNPFENWTRTNADLLGVVEIEVDYSAPVAALRERVGEVVKSSPEWDGRAWNLQVTAAGTSTITVRAMVSAADASALWNLRCEVREALIAFLQAEHPASLPRLRTGS